MYTILLLLLASNPIDYQELRYDVGIDIRPIKPIDIILPDNTPVMLIATPQVDMAAVMFGSDIKQPGDMIPKSRICPGDIVMEATEDSNGKYLIVWQAIDISEPNIIEEFTEFHYEIGPDISTARVIQYVDKNKYIKEKRAK